MITRVVEPEILDSLPPTDPRAVHSRRDLRLINRFMGNGSHIARGIESLRPAPKTILELGAGDGTLLLKVAERLRGPIDLFLLDMQPVVSPDTVRCYAKRGWQVHVLQTRLEEWCRQPAPPHCDLIVANLFLHHFSPKELRGLFAAVQRSARSFVSCDPRRWLPALVCTRFLWLLGCNGVTLNDARISVRAGFRDQELSALWPGNSPFQLQERPAGFSSHFFLATAVQ